MSNENEQELEFEAQEDDSSIEVEVEASQEEEADDSVTLSKKEYKALNYKARAFDSKPKDQPKEDISINDQSDEAKPNTDSIIQTLTALRGVEDDEIAELESEAQSLGVDLIKYIKSDSGKTLLKGIRKTKKSKDAEVGASSKSPVYKKFSQDDMNNMTSEELEKILPRS